MNSNHCGKMSEVVCNPGFTLVGVSDEHPLVDQQRIETNRSGADIIGDQNLQLNKDFLVRPDGDCNSPESNPKETNTTDIEGNKKRRKIRGATNKRKKWWLARGKSNEEAAILCLKPLEELQEEFPKARAWLMNHKSVANKRQHPEETSLKLPPKNMYLQINKDNTSAQPNRIITRTKGIVKKEDKSNNVVKQKPLFSGAANRRMNWWLARGKSREEAEILCLKPFVQLQEHPEVQEWLNPSKVEITESQHSNALATLPTNMVKTNAVKPFQSDLDRFSRIGVVAATRSTEPQIEGTVKPTLTKEESSRVGIIDANRPLSKDDLQSLQEEIMRCIDTTNSGEGPRFMGSSDRAGCLILTCFDKATREWLTTRIPILKPWAGADLRLVEEQDLPKLYYGAARIPDPKLEVSTILRRLNVQNPDLGCAHWKVVNRKVEEKSQIITFSFYEYSLAELNRRNFRAFFNFKDILIRVKGQLVRKEDEPVSSSSLVSESAYASNRIIGGADRICDSINQPHVSMGFIPPSSSTISSGMETGRPIIPVDFSHVSHFPPQEMEGSQGHLNSSMEYMNETLPYHGIGEGLNTGAILQSPWGSNGSFPIQEERSTAHRRGSEESTVPYPRSDDDRTKRETSQIPYDSHSSTQEEGVRDYWRRPSNRTPPYSPSDKDMTRYNTSHSSYAPYLPIQEDSVEEDRDHWRDSMNHIPPHSRRDEFWKSEDKQSPYSHIGSDIQERSPWRRSKERASPYPQSDEGRIRSSRSSYGVQEDRSRRRRRRSPKRSKRECSLTKKRRHNHSH